MEPIRSDRSRPPRRRKDGAASTDVTGGGFARHLNSAEDTDEISDAQNVESTLRSPGLPGGIDAPTEHLFDQVHQAGERLLNENTYSAAQSYREAVQRFLRKVVPDANGIQIEESGYSVLSRKRYYLLTEINRSVDRLVSGLLGTQKKQIDILRRLEEIQGMLVDLIH
ncbi:MAG: DUF327 family protein [Alkalispirochaeta sp.]